MLLRELEGVTKAKESLFYNSTSWDVSVNATLRGQCVSFPCILFY